MPDFSKTVNAALIGCTGWLERPALNLNNIKASVWVKNKYEILLTCAHVM